MLDHMLILFLILWGISYCFHNGCLSLHFHQQYIKILFFFSALLPTPVISCNFKDITILIGVRRNFTVVSTYISWWLMMLRNYHLPVAYLYVFLKKKVHRYFAKFKIRFLDFFVLWVVWDPHIFFILTPYEIWNL